jgi:hypothetical protein
LIYTGNGSMIFLLLLFNYSACFPAIPAQAGIQRQIGSFYLSEDRNSFRVIAIWIPAYAGMT